MSQAPTSYRPLHSHSKSNSQSKTGSASPTPKHDTLRASVLDAASKLGLDNPQVAGWIFNQAISEEPEESEPALTADDGLSSESPLPRTPESHQAPLATIRVGNAEPRHYSPNQQSHVPLAAVSHHHPVGAQLYALGPQPQSQKLKLRKNGPPPPVQVTREIIPASVDKEAEKRKKKEAKEREKEREKSAKEREKEAKEREREAKEREKEAREREAKEREVRERGREARKESQGDDEGSGKKGLMSKFRLKSKERKASETQRPSSPPPPIPAPVVLPIAARFAAKPAEDTDAAQSPDTNRAPSPSTAVSEGGAFDQPHGRGSGQANPPKRFERPPSPPWSKPLDGPDSEGGGDRSTYYVPAPVVRPRTPSPPRQPRSPPMLPLEPVKPLVITKSSPSHSPSLSPAPSPSHSPTHSESSDRTALDVQGPAQKQKSRGVGFTFPLPNPGGSLGMGRAKSPSHSRQPSDEDVKVPSPVAVSPAPTVAPELPASNRSKPRPTAMQFQANPVPLAIKTVISSTPVTQTHEGQRSSTAVSLLDVGGVLPSQRRPSSSLADNGRPMSPPTPVGRPRSPSKGSMALPPPSFTAVIQGESQDTPFSAPLQNQRKPSLSGWPSPAHPQSALPQSSSFPIASPQVPHSALPQSSTFLGVDSPGAQLTAKPSQRGRMPAFPTTPTNPGAVTRSNTRNNGLSPRPRLHGFDDDGSGAFLPPHPDQSPRPTLTRQASQQRRQGLLRAPPSINIDTTDDEALQVFPRRKKETGQKTRRAVRFEMDLSDDEDFRRREPHGPLPTIIIPGHLRSGSQAQVREARRQSFLDEVENAPPANRLQPGPRPTLTMGNNRRRSTYYSSHEGGYNSDGASTEASRLSDYARLEAPADRDVVDKRISVYSNYSEQLDRLSKFIATDRVSRTSSYLGPNDRLSVFTAGDRFSKVTLGSRVSFADSRLSAVSDFDVAAYYGLPGSDDRKRAEDQNRHSTLNVDKERQREIGRSRLVRMLTPPDNNGRGRGYGGRI